MVTLVISTFHADITLRVSKVQIIQYAVHAALLVSRFTNQERDLRALGHDESVSLCSQNPSL